MKKYWFLLIVAVLAVFTAYSQEFAPVKQSDVNDKTSIGLGAGLDYGGFGGSILVYPQRNIGFFAGAGYAIAGIGFNAGAKLRFATDKPTSRIAPYLLAMYGYNVGIAITNMKEYNKFFYGPTFGFGIDYKSRPTSHGYWSLALLLPIRNPDYKAYLDDLKTNHSVVFKNDFSPVGISIGYRFILN